MRECGVHPGYPPAEIQCLWDKFNAPGVAVDTPGIGTYGDQVWVAVGQTLENTGIFYSGDGGATWCYETNSSIDPTHLVSSTQAGCKDADVTGIYTDPCGATHDLLDGFGIPTDIVGLDVSLWTAGEGVAFATFKPEDGATGEGTLAFTMDGGATWTEVTGAPADFLDVRGHILVDPILTTYASSTSHTIRLFVAGESNDAADGGVAEVTWSNCGGTGSCTGTWTTIATSGTGAGDCHVDSTSLTGIALNPWYAYKASNQRLWAWGKLKYNAGTWGGGVCSVRVADPTDQIEVVRPGTGHYYDIAGVVPVPELDRVLLVQPVVNPVTREVCTDGGLADCTRPDPFVVEALRSLGGTTWPWVATTLPTSGLESLRGAGLAVDWVAAPYALYYVTTGTGVQTTEVTW